jgi:hypothetical protein
LRLHLTFIAFSRWLAVAWVFVSVTFPSVSAQQAPQRPSEKPSAKASAPAEPQNPAQFELLETKYRFATDGDSRKEVHARVHINSELGVRQFARLNFDYNRSFQSIDLPLVHIAHPTGGTADILPSAITDNPNAAVVNAPAYQDVRVKSVRILGLEPGDILEYRVITTTTHHPLAPDFWLDHSFDRTGVVSQELFEIDVPAGSRVQLHVAPEFPYETAESENRTDARVVYRWKHAQDSAAERATEPSSSEPQIVFTTYESWQQLATRLAKLFETSSPVTPAVYERAVKLVRAADPRALDSSNPGSKIEALYDFVSQKIRTIDLPLGSTGFRTRAPDDILASGYGTQEDKFLLYAALARDVVTLPRAGLVSNAMPKETAGLARPTLFDHLLTQVGVPSASWWADLNLEVAPYGMIPPQFRSKHALMILPNDENVWREVRIEADTGKQTVNVEAALGTDGKLTAHVHYSMRGDNELLLRISFHQSPKDKWKDLAQLLSLSDGFRGQVTSVSASDPYATREPFTVDYEITQPRFVDWSKKPVRLPALLPQLGLPDPPAKPAPGAATAPIELGTPLDVETKMTLRLPPDTDVAAPTGTSVLRDYATYASQYSIKGLTISASRHINFLLRQIPTERAADYNAFLHAVQSDQAQLFTLDRKSAPTAPSKPAPSQASPPSSPRP